jgi:hypothetical protein
VHESARAVLPDARIAYVDNDPMVCSYVQALLATDERVQAAQADLKDAPAVLGHQAVKAVIDPAEPVCVIVGAVPNLMSAGRPARLSRVCGPDRARKLCGDLLRAVR